MNETAIKPSLLTPQEIMDRLLLVSFEGALWPAIHYDDYSQVLLHLFSQLSVALKKEIFSAILLRRGNVPMAQLLGWEDETGCARLIPVNEENSQSFWTGPFYDWCLQAYSRKEAFSGKMGRAVQLVEEIVRNSSGNTEIVMPTESNDSSPHKVPTTTEQLQQPPIHESPVATTAEASMQQVGGNSDQEEKRDGEASSDSSQANDANDTYPQVEATPQSSASAEPAAVLEAPTVEIDPNDSWEEVWAKMGRMGWKKRTDPKGNRFYVKPGKLLATKILGQDIFEGLEAIQQWACQHYGWKGETSLKQTKSMRKLETSKKCKSATPFLPKNTTTHTNDSPTRVWGLDRQQTKSSRKASPTSTTKKRKASSTLTKNKPATRPSKKSKAVEMDENFYVFNSLWILLKRIGWTCVRATKKWHNWYYVRPSCSIQNGALGVDYFAETADVIRFCQERDYHITYASPASHASGDSSESDHVMNEIDETDNDGGDTPLQSNGKRAVSVNTEECSGYVLSKESTNNDSPSETSNSGNMSSYSTQSDGSYTYSEVWRHLRDEGWRIVKACNRLENWWYELPGRCAKTGIRGVDYLTSEQEVVDFYTRRELAGAHTQVLSSRKQAQKAIPAEDKSPAPVTTKSLEAKEENLEHVSCAAPKIDVTKAVWWQIDPPPEFRKVWPLLNKKLGIRFLGGKYVVPNAPKAREGVSIEGGSGSFARPKDLHKFLCRRGIPDYEKNAPKLTAEEITTVNRWVSFANVPINSYDDTSGMELLTDSEAWDFLRKAGFRGKNGKFVHGTLSFNSMDELRCYVRSLETLATVPENSATGRKQARKHAPSVLSHDENLLLRLWAASSERPLPEFEVPDAWSIIDTKRSLPTPNRSLALSPTKEDSLDMMPLTQDPGAGRSGNQSDDETSTDFDLDDKIEQSVVPRVSLD
jgi:hypothetical protein